MSKSKLETDLYKQIRKRIKLIPKREYKFIPGRKFLADFAWPKLKLAIEVQGGTWLAHGKGAHSWGPGRTRDCEKMNLAQINGWTVLQYTSDMIQSGEAIKEIVAYFDMITSMVKSVWTK